MTAPSWSEIVAVIARARTAPSTDLMRHYAEIARHKAGMPATTLRKVEG